MLIFTILFKTVKVLNIWNKWADILFSTLVKTFSHLHLYMILYKCQMWEILKLDLYICTPSSGKECLFTLLYMATLLFEVFNTNNKHAYTICLPQTILYSHCSLSPKLIPVHCMEESLTGISGQHCEQGHTRSPQLIYINGPYKVCFILLFLCINLTSCWRIHVYWF